MNDLSGVYVVSVMAQRGSIIRHGVVAVSGARSLAEAEGAALGDIRNRWPSLDGWANHDARGDLLSTLFRDMREVQP